MTAAPSVLEPRTRVALDDERVHGAGPLRNRIELIAEGEDGRLVRDGDVAPGEAERGEPGGGFFQPRRLDGQRHVGPVEPPRREGGVLHPGRERVRERVAEQPDEPRPAPER